MYKEFFGLSQQSVDDKIKEYKKGLSQWKLEKERRSAGIILAEKAKKGALPDSSNGKVIDLKNNIDISSDAHEKEVECEADMSVKGSIVDIIVVKYIDAEFKSVNNRLKKNTASNFRPDWEAAVHNDLAAKIEDGTVTLYDLCNRWLVYRMEKGVSRKTFDMERRICRKYILLSASNILCKDVGREVVEDIAVRMLYKNKDMSGSVISRGTVNSRVGVINSILEYGYSNGLVPEKLRLRVNVHDK